MLPKKDIGILLAMSVVEGNSNNWIKDDLGGFSETSVGSDPGAARWTIVLSVFECFNTEWHPKEEEWEDSDSEDEENEEGDVSEEAVDETKLSFSVILATWTI